MTAIPSLETPPWRRCIPDALLEESLPEPPPPDAP